MEQIPGFRFHPTDKELINDYLTNKVHGKTSLVDDVINEINLYDHDPESLPLLSRIKSKDPVYYFFTRTEYKSAKRNSRKRSTKSGYWKPTGKVKKIKDKRGKKKEIGEKRVLVYHLGKVHNGVKTPWVMHEYQMLPHDPDSYAICKIFDNAKEEDEEEEDISIGINSSQSLVFDLSNIRPMSTLPEIEEETFDSFVNDILNPMNEQEDLSPCDGFIQNNNNQPETRIGDEFPSYEENSYGLFVNNQFDNVNEPRRVSSLTIGSNPNMWFFDYNNNNSQLRYLDQEADHFLL